MSDYTLDMTYIPSVDQQFNRIIAHDEVRMKAREAYLDAIEAQLDSTRTTVIPEPGSLCMQNDLALKAAIDAERAAIAAYRKSLLGLETS